MANEPDEILRGLTQHDRNALARAITFVESHRAEDQTAIAQLLMATVPKKFSQRVGITGPPGTGKSTLIESLGQALLQNGGSVAVLTIDPSSPRTGGSIMGDKTRMSRLAQEPRAFIRPSPSRLALGGLSHRTREVLQLLEFFGFDHIIVETVGVGQSEIEVSRLVDCVIMTTMPNLGDEIQGIKRGILEMVDIIFVNKADMLDELSIQQSVAQLSGSLSLIANQNASWQTQVLSGSGLKAIGIDKLIATLADFFATLSADWRSRRIHQEQAAFDSVWQALLFESFKQSHKTQLDICRAQVGPNQPAFVAAQQLIADLT